MFTGEAILASENAIAEFLAKMVLKYGDDILTETNNDRADNKLDVA